MHEAASAKPPPATPPAPRSFAALRLPQFRAFFVGSALAMAADNIEHVISYWIMFRKFHSPLLGGIAVVTHWLPFLLFAFFAGALADRVNPRRLIQIAMLMFIGVSLGWGLDLPLGRGGGVARGRAADDARLRRRAVAAGGAASDPRSRRQRASPERRAAQRDRALSRPPRGPRDSAPG